MVVTIFMNRFIQNYSLPHRSSITQILQCSAVLLLMSTHISRGDSFTTEYTLLPLHIFIVMLPVVVLVALLRVLVQAHALLVLKTPGRSSMLGGFTRDQI